MMGNALVVGLIELVGTSLSKEAVLAGAPGLAVI
jgi:hypothetical protein